MKKGGQIGHALKQFTVRLVARHWCGGERRKVQGRRENAPRQIPNVYKVI